MNLALIRSALSRTLTVLIVIIAILVGASLGVIIPATTGRLSGPAITSTQYLTQTVTSPSTVTQLLSTTFTQTASTTGTLTVNSPITVNQVSNTTFTKTVTTTGIVTTTLPGGTETVTSPIPIPSTTTEHVTSTQTVEHFETSTNTVTTIMTSVTTTTVTSNSVQSILTLIVKPHIVATSSSMPGPDITMAAPGATVYLNLQLFNTSSPTGTITNYPPDQVLIFLSASNGALLSATNIYIPVSDTWSNQTGSFGPIQLSLPNTPVTTVTVLAQASCLYCTPGATQTESVTT
jgi:hypothetical protein